jgi:hypothetical protein
MNSSWLEGEVIEANRTVVRNITPGNDVVNCRRLYPDGSLQSPKPHTTFPRG